MGAILVLAAIGYLFGSIPSGILLARLMGLGNLREIGSGNIGATNVLRTGNKKAAALTLLLDAGKGVLAVVVGYFIGGDLGAQIAGVAAFLGHCFPVWLRFKGGKGVATYFGILFALSWPTGLATGAVWLITAGVSRYSSLAALVAAAAAPLAALMLGEGDVALLCAVLGGLIYWRHLPNIQRLKDGTESKIGAKKA